MKTFIISKPRAIERFRWDRLGTWVLRGYLVIAYAFVLVPIVVTIVFSFNSDRFGSLPWRAFTLDWYGQVIRNPDFLIPLRNSFLVGAGVGVTSVFLGFPGAYALSRSRAWWHEIFLMVMISPLAVPWILLGLSLLVFFNWAGIPKSLMTVWISHTVFAAPLAMLIIRGRLQMLPRNYEEAAWDLGATPLQAILQVVLPLSAPALVSAFLLTFTLSFDEFIIAWFVSGFERTLPLKIWEMMRSGLNPTISAIGAIVFSLSLASAIIGQILLRRGTQG